MDNSKFISFKELAAKYGKDQVQLAVVGTLKSLFADKTVGIIPKNGQNVREGQFGNHFVLIGDGVTNRIIALSKGMSSEHDKGTLNIKRLVDAPIYEVEYELKDNDGNTTGEMRSGLRIGSVGSGQEKPVTLEQLLKQLDTVPTVA